MYCLTIEDKQDTTHLYFKNKDAAKEKYEKLLLDKLNDFIYDDDYEIKKGEIKIESLEVLIISFIKRQYRSTFEEVDVEDYYENNKFEVTLSKIWFEDSCSVLGG